MSTDLLADLPEAERRAVLATSTRRRYRKGDSLYHEGDPGDSLHLLVKGRVAVRCTTILGDTVTLNVLGPGDNFGELSVLEPEQRRSASVVALEPVETMVLSASAIEAAREKHPAISEFLLRLLGRRVRALSDQLVEALHHPVDGRILRRLLEVSALYASSEDDCAIVIPLTQEDLASMAGTTRPTANRVLQGLTAAEVITLSRGRITIVDRDALAELDRRAGP